MNAVVILGRIVTQGAIIIAHSGNGVSVGILKDKAHISSGSTESLFTKIFDAGDLVMHIETDFRDSDVKVGMTEINLHSSVTAKGTEVHDGMERMGILELKENF